MSLLVVAISFLLDYVFAEPRRFHPLVGFGKIASYLETILNRANLTKWIRLISGLIAILLLILPLAILAFVLRPDDIYWALLYDSLILYWAIGARSLELHARAVVDQYHKGSLEGIRAKVAKIVSRDTASMNKQQAVDATLESVLENGSDAVYAPLFWYLVGGSSAVIAYRLSNTLDAMWGYKTQQLKYFGWAAARWDDVINWLPARLTCLTYFLISRQGVNFRKFFSQAKAWESPNAGPVLSAGAWALGLHLGGVAQYHGHVKQRANLGPDREATIEDIHRATRLIRQGLLLWLLLWALGSQFV